MKRFLAKEWDKAKARKRGGEVRLVPLQLDTAETRYSQEPADTRTPEQLFEKQWALTLLKSVLDLLREDYAHDGKGALFHALEPCLIGICAATGCHRGRPPTAGTSGRGRLLSEPLPSTGASWRDSTAATLAAPPPRPAHFVL